MRGVVRILNSLLRSDSESRKPTTMGKWFVWHKLLGGTRLRRSKGKEVIGPKKRYTSA